MSIYADCFAITGFSKYAQAEEQKRDVGKVIINGLKNFDISYIVVKNHYHRMFMDKSIIALPFKKFCKISGNDCINSKNGL